MPESDFAHAWHEVCTCSKTHLRLGGPYVLVFACNRRQLCASSGHFRNLGTFGTLLNLNIGTP